MRTPIAALLVGLAFAAIPLAAAGTPGGSGPECEPPAIVPLLQIPTDECDPCDEPPQGNVQAASEPEECEPDPCEPPTQTTFSTASEEECNPCQAPPREGTLSTASEEECCDEVQPDGVGARTDGCTPPPCVENCPPTPPTEIPFFPSAGALALGVLGAAGVVGMVVLRRKRA